jgi:hypothetical protein
MIEATTDIRYLRRDVIDPEKWDQCILQSPNGLIYARSFYLDAMAENWSGLISGDYDAIMPLTWNRKLGFSYLYQPAFTAQLGMFAKNNAGGIGIENFINEAKNHFKFCEIHLNYLNKPADCIQRANYILALDKPYSETRMNYKKRLLENLAEADVSHIQYFASDDFSTTVFMFQKEYGKRFPQVKNHHFQKFVLLCHELVKRNMLFVRQVKDSANNMLSSSIFFSDHRRIYNIMSVTGVAGREKRSHFYLIDQLIREFSSRDIIFDFEGSELAGVAEFYKKFGSRLAPYPFLKFNHLPFPFNLFK